MILRLRFWRFIIKDKVFFSLVILSLITFSIVCLIRQPTLERSSLAFGLGAFFFGVNFGFAFLTQRRDPLLSYMFLTANLLTNGALVLFYRYLSLVQGG